MMIKLLLDIVKNDLNVRVKVSPTKLEEYSNPDTAVFATELGTF